MDWINRLFQLEYLITLLENLVQFGPLGGILLAMIEAFFPPLPLSLFVTINVMAFGFFFGYIYSFVGTTVGSVLVFFIIKKLGQERFERRIERSRRLKNIFIWIKAKGFIPIFILLTFPFTPSIVVCGLAALADVKNRTYIWATVLGKMFMVLSLSFIGYNITSFVTQPVKSIILILATISVSFIAKRIIGLYEKRLEIKHGGLNDGGEASKKKIA